LKGEIFREVLVKQGIDLKPLPITAGSNSPYFYRNSIRFFFVQKSDGSISFARHNIDFNQGYVEVESCLLQSKKCNEILTKLISYINKNIEEKGMFWQLKIREGKYTGELMVEIITTGEQLPDKERIANILKGIDNIKSVYHTVAPGRSLKQISRHLLFGSPIIYEKIGSFKFQISPESFFQTNSLGIKKLYDTIKEFAQISPKDSVLDLYCGTGTIGIYLSRLAQKVVGIEAVPEAMRDAQDNARINHIHNCEFICANVPEYLKSLEISPSAGRLKLDIIVVDPPRAGLTKSTIKLLSKAEFTRLIYVSCNPATFARDILEFNKLGISLVKIQPIDMFPQTHHIECVGLLKKTR
jgi:23S rRNA (uracil1939-C5)-methyltransferase